MLRATSVNTYWPSGTKKPLSFRPSQNSVTRNRPGRTARTVWTGPTCDPLGPTMLAQTLVATSPHGGQVVGLPAFLLKAGEAEGAGGLADQPELRDEIGRRFRPVRAKSRC